MAQKSSVNVVLGLGSIGLDSEPLAREIVTAFRKHGHFELDTARIYVSGTSETLIGQITQTEKGLVVDTKIPGGQVGPHTAENIAKNLEESLKQLQTDKVHILYLHSPDPTTPFDVTLAAINDQFKKGRFEKFGLSNYTAAEVEQFVEIAEKNNYVKPSVYQGMYNILERSPEDKLFPVLRKHKISFFAYSPLAGGFLARKVEGTQRWTPGTFVGDTYRNVYHKESFFQALEKLETKAQGHGLTVPEVAFRWLSHHSALRREHGDAVIIGGKSLSSFESSLQNLDKDKLPSDLVSVVEELWQEVKQHASPFVKY